MTVLAQTWRAHTQRVLPGTLVCATIALAATYLSEHYGGPQLLYALLIGLAFHFLSHSPSVMPGVAFCGRTVLRLGVALLVVGIGASLGGPTGYAINPARDLGPRIAHAGLPIKDKGSSDWGYSWIPVVGPIVGGVLAGWASTVLLP